MHNAKEKWSGAIMRADRRSSLASVFSVFRTLYHGLTAFCCIAALCRPGDAVHLERSVTIFGKVVFGPVTHMSMEGNNDIQVTWEIRDPTQALSPNYIVTYSYRLYKACGSNSILHSQWVSRDYPAGVTTIILPSMQPWQDYLFKLKAPKTHFKTEEWVNGTFQTHYTAPTGSVQGLQVMSVTDTEAKVRWTPPTCPSRGGPLYRYEVELTTPTGPLYLLLDAGKATEVLIKQLQPQTDYTIRVRYVNTDGEGPFSGPVTFRTKPYGGSSSRTRSVAFTLAPPVYPGGPGTLTQSPAGGIPKRTTRSGYAPNRPTFVRQTSSDLTCVTISWKREDKPTIPVYGYEIYDLTSKDYESTMVPLASPGPTADKATICDLYPGKQYRLGVIARGAGDARSTPSEIYVKTENAPPPKPSPPKILSVTDTTVAIEITGVVGKEGPVTAYHIWVEPYEMSESEKVEFGVATPPKGYVKGDVDEPSFLELASEDGEENMKNTQRAGANIDKGEAGRPQSAGAQIESERGSPNRTKGENGFQTASSSTETENSQDRLGNSPRIEPSFPVSGEQSAKNNTGKGEVGGKDVKRESKGGAAMGGAPVISNTSALNATLKKNANVSADLPLQLPYIVPILSNETVPEDNTSVATENKIIPTIEIPTAPKKETVRLEASAQVRASRREEKNERKRNNVGRKGRGKISVSFNVVKKFPVPKIVSEGTVSQRVPVIASKGTFSRPVPTLTVTKLEPNSVANIGDENTQAKSSGSEVKTGTGDLQTVSPRNVSPGFVFLESTTQVASSGSAPAVRQGQTLGTQPADDRTVSTDLTPSKIYTSSTTDTLPILVPSGNNGKPFLDAQASEKVKTVPGNSEQTALFNSRPEQTTPTKPFNETTAASRKLPVLEPVVNTPRAENSKDGGILTSARTNSDRMPILEVPPESQKQISKRAAVYRKLIPGRSETGRDPVPRISGKRQLNTHTSAGQLPKITPPSTDERRENPVDVRISESDEGPVHENLLGDELPSSAKTDSSYNSAVKVLNAIRTPVIGRSMELRTRGEDSGDFGQQAGRLDSQIPSDAKVTPAGRKHDADSIRLEQSSNHGNGTERVEWAENSHLDVNADSSRQKQGDTRAMRGREHHDGDVGTGLSVQTGLVSTNELNANDFLSLRRKRASFNHMPAGQNLQNINRVISRVKRTPNSTRTRVAGAMEQVDNGPEAMEAAGVNPKGYITAELPVNVLNPTAIFIVGDQRIRGGYVNRPLSPYGRYAIFLKAISRWNSKYKTSMSDPVRLRMPKEMTVYQSARNDRAANIIVISVLISVALLASLFFILWRLCHHSDTAWAIPNPPVFYQMKGQNRNQPPPLTSLLASPPPGALDSPMSRPGFGEGVSGRIGERGVLGGGERNQERHWSPAYDVAEPRYIVTGRDLLPPSQVTYPPLPMRQALGVRPVTFREEFLSLPDGLTMGTSPFEAESARWQFSPGAPFDGVGRIPLDGNGGGDYYNGSYVQGYTDRCGHGFDYIAGQSPFDEAAVVNLWRLIYQNGVATVVSMSRVIEDGVLKCIQYWPEMGKADYGPFKVSLVDQFTYSDFTERLVSVKNRKRQHAKVLLTRIFCFSGWPDKGMPQDAVSLLELRSRVLKTRGLDRSPVLVHCETGAGRTAVYIALDMALTEYLNEGQISIYNTVSRMRNERPRMVQNLAQYYFVYEALFEELHAGDTVVGDDLRERYEELARRNPNTNQSYLRDQYHLLKTLTSQGQGPAGLENQESYRGLSNDVPDLIPSRPTFNRRAYGLDINFNSGTWRRVQGRDLDCDDIDRAYGNDILDDFRDGDVDAGLMNEVFVDGYRRQNEFIMAATPHADGAADFWQLVYDNNVHSIVTMDTEDGREGEFWPAERSGQWDPYVVELTSVSRDDDNITVRTFTLINVNRTRDKPRVVRQFQFHAWSATSSDQYLTRRGSFGSTRCRNQHNAGGRRNGYLSQGAASVGTCPPPSSKAAILDLIQLVQEWQQQASLDSTPVLVHCCDGATCSGLFVALSLVVSRMEEEGQVSVYRIARRLRKRCQSAIDTFEQYKFLYKALWDYMNLRMRCGRYAESLAPTFDSPAPDRAFGMSYAANNGVDLRERIVESEDLLSPRSLRSPRSQKSRSPTSNRVNFSEMVNDNDSDWDEDSDKSGSSSSSSDEDDHETHKKRQGRSPRGPSSKGRSPGKFEVRHVQVESYDDGNLKDRRPPRPEHQDRDVFRFKPHSLYPRLDGQGTSPLSTSSPYRCGHGRPRSGSTCTRQKRAVATNTSSTRSLPPSPCRTPSPITRRPLPTPSPTAMLTRPLSAARQRRRDSLTRDMARPVVSRDRPPPKVSPQKLLADFSGTGTESSGAIKSESLMQEITEMMDEHGTFYRQEMTDRVTEFSSTSTKSDV